MGDASSGLERRGGGPAGCRASRRRRLVCGGPAAAPLDSLPGGAGAVCAQIVWLPSGQRGSA
jgi:hypothetical protein